MPLFRPQGFLRPYNVSQFSRTFSTTPAAKQFAQVTLIGRLAAEPELTATSTGRDLVKYSIGTSYGPRDDRQTSWWKVVSFDERGRDTLLAVPKGSLVHVVADARMRTYEDGEGKRRSQLDLSQRYLNVLSRPQSQSSREGAESDTDAAEEPSSGLGAS